MLDYVGESDVIMGIINEQGRWESQRGVMAE